MSSVQLLPQVLANQIAAGEIVERPASVVKELVENSIDAEASRIAVEVIEGGKKRIIVSDDGVGMSEADARLAFEHHATSKIASLEDLSRIQTLGFRGEALPSIASVSRVCLKTANGTESEKGSVGTEIYYQGGELDEVRPSAWPRGTEVTIEDLFFNVPARKKFLRADSTELTHVSRQLTNYALAYPEIEFQLTHGQRKLLEAPAVGDLRQRIFQVLGDTFLESLVPLEYEREGIKITGFTSLPHEQRSTAHSLFLYVNRRMVRDRILMHAVRQAYQDLIPPGCFPVLLLFIQVDPDQIDVNVHPSKIEIRFHRSQAVHVAVTRSIEQALLLNKTSMSSLARPLSLDDDNRRHRIASRVEKFFRHQPDSSFGFPAFRRRDGSSFSGHQPGSAEFRPTNENSSFDGAFSAPAPGSEQAPHQDPHADDIPETAYLSPVPLILGQFVESFIVAADREGVLLVDQHVAHERILYDRALKSLSSSAGLPVQRLLIPQTLELSSSQGALAGTLLDYLNNNGFEVEWFGEQTLLIRGLPALAGETDPVAVVEEVFSQLETLGEVDEASEQSLERRRQKIAISLSCRAAIKINTPLSEEKMQWLLDELFRCQNPYTCPHGRPILLRLNIEEILKGFKRI